MSLPTFAAALLVACLGSGVLRATPSPRPRGPCPEGLVSCAVNSGTALPPGAPTTACVRPCRAADYGPSTGHCDVRTGCAVLYLPAAPPPPRL